MKHNVLLEGMLERRNESQVAGLMRFFKTGPGQYGEGDKFLGIKVPVTREVVKDCWKDVSFKDLEECILSEYHEVRLAALLCLVAMFNDAGKKKPTGKTFIQFSKTFREKCVKSKAFKASAFQKQDTQPKAFKTSAIQEQCPHIKAFQKVCVDFYLSHTGCINNWDLVDLSCYSLIGTYLLDKDRTLLYDLARSGKNIWEQRIGIVSTMAFIRKGQLDDTYAIADILLYPGQPQQKQSKALRSNAISSKRPDAVHDLIQKAVGWLLREAGKRDEKSLRLYLASRYKSMPRTALRYAIEKFPEPLRQSYLKSSEPDGQKDKETIFLV